MAGLAGCVGGDFSMYEFAESSEQRVEVGKRAREPRGKKVTTTDVAVGIAVVLIRSFWFPFRLKEKSGVLLGGGY